jgi:hypothetical protein
MVTEHERREARRLERIERDRDRARAALGIDERGRDVRPPSWLQARPADDGLVILGRGLDDVDDVPAVNRPQLDDELDGDWLNPDCRGGKHAACGGDAWSDELDQRVACLCSCHDVVDVEVGEAYL